MSHENSKAMAGSLPEEPGLPTTCHQTQYYNVEPVSENVRTPDAPVSSRLRSTSDHPVTSGTTELEPMGSLVVKPQATHANDQSVGGLPLDQSTTTPHHPQASSSSHQEVFTRLTSYSSAKTLSSL